MGGGGAADDVKNNPEHHQWHRRQSQVHSTGNMLPQLWILLLGCQLICGTPAPTNEIPEETPAPPTTEKPRDSTPLYNEPKPLPQNPNVAQPVISISERVQAKPREKKDLGTLGYVLGILMVVIIIAIGSGIVVGYIYKRSRDIKKQHDQQMEERRQQRINLPLSAFLNPTCDIIDENTIEVSSNRTPNTVQEGVEPLMGSAGTPGA